MKKNLFSIFYFLFSVFHFCNAQTNLNLEIWGGNNLKPAEWATLNVLAQIGTQTTFKETSSPGQGFASAKMVTSFCTMCATFGVPLDTVAGIIVSGDTTNNTFGVPYTQTPQYLSFRYKANPQPGDAGIVAVQLTHYDTILDSTITIAEGIFLETNVVSNWTNMLLPIQYFTVDTPDTLIIASSSSASFIFSGNPALGVKKIGSEFYADTFNLYFSFPCSFNDLSVTVSSTDETTSGANDGTATATVSGGFSPFTYLWSNANTNNSISNLAPATYAVTVTDSVGCTAIDSAVVNVASSCTLSVTATSSDETAPGSNDGTANAVVSGGTSPYSYNWSNGAFTASISNLAPAIYTVTITDAMGCTATASATVNPFNCTITASATSTAETGTNANDGTATTTVSGGNSPYSFNWNNAQTNSTATALSPGTYSVTVTDAIGCTAIATTVVDSFVCSFTANATATNETSFGANDGTASVTTADGISPYSYLWNNNDTTSTISGLAPGTYFVTVTDGNICTAIASATVNAASICGNFTISNIQVTEPNCAGGNDGQITVNTSGGSGVISYLWSNGNSGNTAYNLNSGNYSVTATDVNNCISDSTIFVSQPFSLAVSISHTDETCANCKNGTMSVSASGGTQPYSYQWTNGETSPSIDSLAAGIYSVIILDANGCYITASDTVLPAILEVEEINSELQFTIYPNPNDGKFNLMISQFDNLKMKKIEIFNLIGEKLYSKIPTTSNEQLSTNLEIGIYFVKLETEGRIYTRKIIVE